MCFTANFATNYAYIYIRNNGQIAGNMGFFDVFHTLNCIAKKHHFESSK